MNRPAFSPWTWLAPIDVIGALLAFSLAYWIRISSSIIPYTSEASFNQYLELYVYSVPVLLVIFQTMGLYERHGLFQGTAEYTQILKGCVFYIFGVVVVSFAARGPSPSRGWLVTTWALSVVILSLDRIVFRRLVQRIWKRRHTIERALVLGVSEDSKKIAEQLELGGSVEVVGFLSDFSPQGAEVWNGKQVLGVPSRYRNIAEETDASLAILVLDANSWETQREVMSYSAIGNGVELQIAPGLSDLQLVSMKVGFKGNVPLLRFRSGYITGLNHATKEVLDYVLATAVLILALPIMTAIGMLLGLQGGGRIIKGFDVTGRHGKNFRTYKFRTGEISLDSYRSFRKRALVGSDGGSIGKTERLLFHTGLDKLPQLFNVLMGQMSIVGPRTISLEASKRYSQWLSSILMVKPGITGSWAMQNTGELEQEISLTLHYVRNWSLWADLTIIGQTVYELFRTRFRTRILTLK